jgi:HEAT repeat protein
MKGYEGEILADCGKEGIWKKEGLPLSERNPYCQADGHRRSLINHLMANFAKNSYAPSWSRDNDYSLYDWIARHVDSWVVTQEASIIRLVGVNQTVTPWFRVMPLEMVSRNLPIFYSEPILSPIEQIRLIESLGASLVHEDDWYRGHIIESPIDAGLIPKITDLIRSQQHEDIIKSLKYIRELELNQHLMHVIECWHNKEGVDVRQEALLILIDWSFEDLGTILNEALNDSKPSIVWFALDYLTKYGYIEPVPSLTRYLKNGVTKAKVAAIKGIAISGASSAQTIILNYTKTVLSNQPFTRFQLWKQLWDEYYKKVMAHQQDKEFEHLNADRSDLIETSTAAIDALGDLNCKECIPLLKEIIENPSAFGFKTNDYQELISYHTGYFGIFESAVRALGKLGIGNETVTELLVSKLQTAPEDYQQDIIQALGALGDRNAEFALIPFVKSENNLYFYDAALALSKMKSKIAFDYLAKVYLRNKKDHPRYSLEKALANINPRKFEKLLLDQLRAEKNCDEDKGWFLRSLGPIVSVRSAPMLFSLLKNPELADTAAAFIGKLSHDKSIFSRAKKLTESQDPIEQALGIWILDWYYLEDLHRLDKFRKPNTPVEVRRAVSSLFSIANAKKQLVEYANDPDHSVRQSVFWSVTEKADLRCLCYAISNCGQSTKCEIAINKDFLVIKFPDQVTLVPRQSIKYGAITSNTQGVYGVLMELSPIIQGIETLLLVPLDRYLHLPRRMTEVLFAELHLIERKQPSDKDSLVSTELWRKVPENLAPKDEYDGSALNY